MIAIGGVGPGNPKYLTREVYEKILDTDIVIAFGRVASGLNEIRDDILAFTKVDDLKKYIEENSSRNILILASGDPNFYGIVDYLMRNAIEVDQVYVGMTSFQYLMGKLKKPWQNANLLSLHGREMPLESIRDFERSIILTDRENNPNYISRKLYDMGIRGKLCIGYDLSYDGEEIIEIEIGQEVKNDSILAVVVVENEMD